jgi:D-alanyl-D-alanine carboxypeptidase
VAAITERNPAEIKLASADPDDGADSDQPNKATDGGRSADARAPAQSEATAAPQPVPLPPLPATRPAAATATPQPAAVTVPPPAAPQQAARIEAKPMPAPLSSGVIAQQTSIVPGSQEPMTPVRVKTVQIKAGPQRLASASAVAAAPVATASIPPAVPEVAETSNSVVAKAELPPPNPKFGTGQGILGTLPASALQQHGTTVASNEPPSHLPQPAAAPAIPPASNVKAVTHSGWIIQVGALESESEAKQRLDAARGSAAGLLGNADPFTETVSKGGKSYYRARFAGLDKDRAEAACRALKHNDISCIAIRN